MSGLVVHEWMGRIGGSERVVDAMLRLHDDADLLCLWDDERERRPDRDVRETWLARTPLRRRKAAALPLMPLVWRRVRLPRYDWLLVSSHLFAHHVSGGPLNRTTTKFVYAHSPARYVWDPAIDGRGRGPAARVASAALRPLDRRRSQEAAAVAANSRFVRDRVQRAWRRDAEVIYPPVEVERIAGRVWRDACTADEQALVDGLPDPFLLGASRFIPYKRLDRVIAAGEAAAMPVVIAGDGPQREQLVARAVAAAVPVTVVTDPSDELLYALYQRAFAYVFPAVEDFGIMPVEAMAAGTPVIVSAVGGASESVVHGRTGHHVTSFEPCQLRDAVRAVEAVRRDDCVARAKEFGPERFAAELSSWMADDRWR